MKRKLKSNSGFSLIELIIALAVMAFLMLAVSSFMGSSVMQSRKAKVDVKMQTNAQETYSLFTDSIMQASNVLIVGYTASDDNLMTFSEIGDDGKETAATLTKRYYVRDKDAAKALMDSPSTYGISGSVSSDEIVLFQDVDVKTKIYVTSMRIESSVPLDMNQVPGANTTVTSEQTIKNTLTGADTKVSAELKGTKMVYSINDTLVSSFVFDGNSLYYGRRYAYMTKLNDVVDMTSDDSKSTHLYNKYFSYRVGKSGAVDVKIPGCVATVSAADGTIGIDLFYNQKDMTYTTLGRINTRNSFVLKPRK